MIATKYHDRLSIFNLLVSPPLKGEEIHILSIINPHFPHSFLSSLLPFFTLPSSNFYFHTPPLIISLLLSLLLAVLHLSSFHSPGLYHPHYSHCFILFLFFFCFFFPFYWSTRESCPSQLYNHEGRGRKEKRGSVEFERGFKRTCPFCQLNEAWETKILSKKRSMAGVRTYDHTYTCTHKHV